MVYDEIEDSIKEAVEKEKSAQIAREETRKLSKISRRTNYTKKILYTN